MHNRGQLITDEMELFGSSYILMDIRDRKPMDFRTDSYIISMTEGKYLDTEEARCINDQAAEVDHPHLRDCILNYIQDQLGCKLPWTKNHGNRTVCQGIEHVSLLG